MKKEYTLQERVKFQENKVKQLEKLNLYIGQRLTPDQIKEFKRYMEREIAYNKSKLENMSSDLEDRAF